MTWNRQFPFFWSTKSKTLENQKQFLYMAIFLDNLFFWNSLYEIQWISNNVDTESYICILFHSLCLLKLCLQFAKAYLIKTGRNKCRLFFSNVIRMRAPDAYIHKMCLISLTEKLACIKLFNLFSRSTI